MKIIWDSDKALLNLKKHNVSFSEAATVFYAPLSATGEDPDHSLGEFRYITFGVSGNGNLLVVSPADQGTAIRIISARKATRRERAIYEKG